MPSGKAAGERCVQLTAEDRCALFGKAERPEVCATLRPNAEMCGESRAEAMAYFVRLDALTRPVH